MDHEKISNMPFGPLQNYNILVPSGSFWPVALILKRSAPLVNEDLDWDLQTKEELKKSSVITVLNLLGVELLEVIILRLENTWKIRFFLWYKIRMGYLLKFEFIYRLDRRISGSCSRANRDLPRAARREGREVPTLLRRCAPLSGHKDAFRLFFFPHSYSTQNWCNQEESKTFLVNCRWSNFYLEFLVSVRFLI